jgi:hypothetical protein
MTYAQAWTQFAAALLVDVDDPNCGVVAAEADGMLAEYAARFDSGGSPRENYPAALNEVARIIRKRHR